MKLSIRPYERHDENAVLQLVEADILPGQPAVTNAMLSDALAGRSTVDSSWWDELDPAVTEVAHDTTGQVLGVVSYATRARDRAGVILWLHCSEDQTIATILLNHALSQLGHKRTIHAFEFATALSLGLEAFPVRHRPATHRALTESGFTGEDLWRYMRASLPMPDLPRAAGIEVSPAADHPGQRLMIRRNGDVIAEAVIGTPFAGVGVLWWISVEPVARGQRIGLALLGSAVDLLAELGAEEVILFVDDDAAPGDSERDRTAANRMYDRAGFEEVDRLLSFTRPSPS
ncbi:GNAT family N-acetyltransferase [Kribbella sp. NBC_01245]|uniref:GNAT family N-acetyltransferase n=1 Tax=Kribbella sp. NBC_01245 TaxID=2903578 RepID=UPI002E2BAC2B|nr:GNAT family N-acetyltransferase [Kribbella sp. NBC_01245]